MYSTSTTKVFFDVAIDNQPAGRLVFKVYDDLEKWTAPFSTTFIKLAEMGKNRPQALSSFIGSEFQRCGQGRGSAVAFSTTGKSDVDLFEMRKLFEFMMREVPFTNAIKQVNPLSHDREGLLTAVTEIPERYLRKNDFMRQLINAPNPHAKTMFALLYEPYKTMDGKFQVIGELIEGWDTLLEIECACVQPLSYYYPNNQHLIAYMEQTGSENDPILLERIAAGLQTDSFVPGLLEAQLSLDEGNPESQKDTEYETERNEREKSVLSPEQKRAESLKGIPIALRPALESAESAEIKEREKWEAWENKGNMDYVSMNKYQKYARIDNRKEAINSPTIGPGPMTASATITNSGLLKTERKLLSAAFKDFTN